MYQPIYRDRCGRTIQKPAPWWRRWLGHVPRYRAKPGTPPDGADPAAAAAALPPPCESSS